MTFHFVQRDKEGKRRPILICNFDLFACTVVTDAGTKDGRVTLELGYKKLLVISCTTEKKVVSYFFRHKIKQETLERGH